MRTIMRKILTSLLLISCWVAGVSAQAGGDMFSDAIQLGVASSHQIQRY